MTLIRSSKLTGKRRSRWWWLIELAVVIALIMGVRAWSHLSLVSGEAPAFEAEMIGGESVQLMDYRGEPVLLYFWMPDCVSCRLQRSSISTLAKNYSVLTIVSAEDETVIQKYMTENEMSDWPTIVDKSGDLHRMYGVMAAPTLYIIDGEGLVRFKEVGITSSWGLQLRLWLAGAGSRIAEETSPEK